jgi:hypothetical protein
MGMMKSSAPPSSVAFADSISWGKEVGKYEHWRIASQLLLCDITGNIFCNLDYGTIGLGWTFTYEITCYFRLHPRTI